jgi:hypothetical protein
MLKIRVLWYTALFCTIIYASENGTIIPLTDHPDTSDWPSLFQSDLSNALGVDTVWTYQDSILTATADHCLWTQNTYDNFILDLEFKNASGTNSGVIVYCSDISEWIPNSVEIQIADDYAQKWATSPKTWQCGAFFGHKPAEKRMVRPPGEWNRYTITCRDSMIYVLMNGQAVNQMNMKLWTSNTTNPDGSEIPPWLHTPKASLPTKGHIGLQGKHAGAPVYFKNIKIKELFD